MIRGVLHRGLSSRFGLGLWCTAPAGFRLGASTLIAALVFGSCAPLALAQAPSPPTTLVLNEGHAGDIKIVAASPDGKLAATSADDNRIVVWDIGTGRIVRRIEVADQYVKSVAFTGDGQRLLVGGDVWEIASGRRVSSLEPFSRIVAGYSANGQIAAMPNPDGTLQISDVAAGRPLRQIRVGENLNTSIALSSDGKTIAMIGDDKKIRLLDGLTGRQLRGLPGTTEELSSPLVFSPDNRQIAAVGEGFAASLKIWDVATGKLARSIKGDIKAFAYTPDGKSIVAVGESGLTIFNAQTGAVLRSAKIKESTDIPSSLGSALAVAVSADGASILTDDGEGGLVQFDAKSGRKLKNFGPALAVQAEPVLALALSGDGSLLASAHDGGFKPGENGPPDKSIKLWDTRTGQIVGALAGHTLNVLALAASADGALLASAGDDKLIKIWDLRAKAEVRTIKFGSDDDTSYDSEHVLALAFTPDGRTLIGGGRKIFKAWDVASGNEIRSYAITKEIHSLAVHPAGAMLLVSEGDKVVLVDIATGNVIRSFEGKLSGPKVAFSPDGKQIVASGSSTITVWNTESGDLVTTFARAAVVGGSQSFSCVSFTPDGTRVLAGSSDQSLRLSDVRTGRYVRLLAPAASAITNCLLSRDGKTVFAGTKRGEIGIWATDSGTQLATMRNALGASFVTMTTEGAYVASSDADGFVTALRGMTVLPATVAASFRHPELVEAKIAGDPAGTVRAWWAGLNPGAPQPGTAVASTPAIVLFERPSVRTFMGQDKARIVENVSHVANIGALALSPDGRQLVTTDSETTMKLWDVKTGRLIQSFSANGDMAVYAMVYSADGQQVVTGGRRGEVKSWDVQSGQMVREFKGHTEVVNAIAVSPDGKRVITGAEDKTLRIWDAAMGNEIRRIDMAEDSVSALAVFPDNRRLVVAKNSRIEVLDIETGERLRSFGTGQVYAKVEAIAISAQGDLIATGQFHRLDLWDASEGLLRSMQGESIDGHGLAFTADGQKLLSGGLKGHLALWEVNTGRASAAFKTGADDFISSLALLPDGQHLLTATGASVKLWDIGSGERVRTFGTPVQSVNSVAFTQDGRRLISGGVGSVRVWDAERGELSLALEPQPYYIEALALSGDDKSVLAVHRNRMVRLLALDTGKEQRSITEPLRSNGTGSGDPLLGTLMQRRAETSAWLTAGTPSPDGKWIAAGSNDGTAKIWDAATGKLVRALTGHADEVMFANFSPDGRTILTGSSDRTLKLWDAQTGALIRTFQGHRWTVRAAAFSRDGKQILSGSGDATMILWNADTGQPIRTFEGHRGVVRSVAYSPDEKRVVSGSYDSTVKLWDVATGRMLWSVDAHAGEVHAVAYSPDGQRIASGGSDGTVKIWSAADGALLATLIAAPDAGWMVYTPEGFYAGSKDGPDKLSIVRGADAAPLGTLQDVLNRPDLLREKLAGDAQARVRERAAQIDIEAATRPRN